MEYYLARFNDTNPVKPMTTTSQANISDSDREVLDRIRHEGSISIARLCDLLEVTATAIRQRLSRLVAAGLVERVQVKQERGRPRHMYQLTSLGLKAMGENLGDLAEAMWAEVIRIPDPNIRNSVIEGVLRRLVNQYREEVTGQTVTERLRSIAALFRRRRIPFVLEDEDNQASLRIVGCPYPELNEHGSEICQLEQRLVAELLDAPVALEHCRCESSGGQCCTFSARSPVTLQTPTTAAGTSSGGGG
jgi:predicted ArsR family transcriptional regulator